MPSSSPSSRRKSSYTRSASALRPAVASAAISSARGRSRSGSSSASAASSTTSPSVAPAARRPSARVSTARIRSSSRRIDSARPSSTSSSSGIRRALPPGEGLVDGRQHGRIRRLSGVQRRGQALGVEVDPGRRRGGTRRPSTRSRRRGDPAEAGTGGCAGRPPGPVAASPATSASIAASTDTTRPRRSTSNASSRRCSVALRRDVPALGIAHPDRTEHVDAHPVVCTHLGPIPAGEHLLHRNGWRDRRGLIRPPHPLRKPPMCQSWDPAVGSGRCER